MQIVMGVLGALWMFAWIATISVTWVPCILIGYYSRLYRGPSPSRGNPRWDMMFGWGARELQLYGNPIPLLRMFTYNMIAIVLISVFLRWVFC